MEIVEISDVKAKESESAIFKRGKVTMQPLVGEKRDKGLHAFVVNFSPGAKP